LQAVVVRVVFEAVVVEQVELSIQQMCLWQSLAIR
jgi:hypothetical protein